MTLELADADDTIRFADVDREGLRPDGIIEGSAFGILGESFPAAQGAGPVSIELVVEDAAGNNVAPAVGDLLIRVLLDSGGGTVDFAYGLQYFVEP